MKHFFKVSKVLVFLCSVLFMSHAYSAQLLSFQGKALDLETGTLLYVEDHQIILNEAGDYLSGFVTYTNPEGEVFAEKTLDYAKSSLAPDMVLFDKRSNERTHVSLNQSSNTLQVLFESDKKQTSSDVKIDEPLVVVDAGFDRLIDSKWEQFRKNKELKFTFLAITRSQLINFEAIEIGANDASVSVELHPRNFFINILVDPISLQYDLKTKRLQFFEGLTNIEKYQNGKRTEENYIARIEYVYEPIKPFSRITKPVKGSQSKHATLN